MLILKVWDMYSIVVALLTTICSPKLVFRYWRIGEETTGPRTASEAPEPVHATSKYILQPYIPLQSANNAH